MCFVLEAGNGSNACCALTTHRPIVLGENSPTAIANSVFTRLDKCLSIRLNWVSRFACTVIRIVSRSSIETAEHGKREQFSNGKWYETMSIECIKPLDSVYSVRPRACVWYMLVAPSLREYAVNFVMFPAPSLYACANTHPKPKPTANYSDNTQGYRISNGRCDSDRCVRCPGQPEAPFSIILINLIKKLTPSLDSICAIIGTKPASETQTKKILIKWTIQRAPWRRNWWEDKQM